MRTPDTVKRLVETFDRNLASYRTPAYNETQLRRDFLDPFFEALGWDVANRKGYDQRYREVVHEDAIKVGGTTKAPDYCFRVGGVRKFFVEAKAPVHDIGRDPRPAFQLRRYAWTAKLPVSILTDFEEFSVYDTRVRPTERDKAGAGRLRLIPYREYEQTWEELVGTFSPEAIQQGAFDRYAEGGRKRGTTPVDAEFLKDIERWRDALARNIALRNPRLTDRELNASVQRTIDRIIFLRICEDRGIEPAAGLQALTNGVRIYPRLFELFRRADDRYNSGLFHFTAERGREEPDDLTPRLKVDDAVLKTIIGQLYYPSPYEFSVLPADILGQVYEQFLGKVIRLTAGHRAKVEDKPEVRKAGGVYYTPTYIVDYIVKNTVGALLWGYPAESDGTCLSCGGNPFAEGLSGSGARGLGPGKKGAEIVGTNSELRGPEGLAGSDESGRTGVLRGPGATRKRAVRATVTDDQGGSFRTCEHCGRTWLQPPPGLSESSLNQPGLVDGTGNLPDTHRTAEDAQAGSGQGTAIEGRHRGQASQRANPRASSYTPAPNPQSPIPNPQPLIPGPKSPTPNPRALTPARASRLRILDPACGSGSFLLGAYQYLLDWHRDHYVKAGPEKHRKELYEGPGGEWRLTTQEKKRILLNNIYGVDIDAQAVEVTKLSLLLKVLEGESEQTITSQLRMFRVRALPDLSSNIKCGNSLIGSDFWQGEQQTMFDDEEQRLRINAFDWEHEFPDIIKAGGFDAVIGNPPYVLLQDEFRDDHQLYYFRRRYAAASYKLDTYHLFIELGLRLTRTSGRFSMITPANFITNNFLAPLRRLILEKTEVDHISVVEHGVFPGVSVDNAVFVFRPSAAPHGTFPVIRSIPSSNSLIEFSRESISVPATLESEYALFTGGDTSLLRSTWKRIAAASVPLGRLARVNFGKQLRDRKIHKEDVLSVQSKSAIPPTYRPCYTGRDISRYALEWGKRACLDAKTAQRGGCWDPAVQNAHGKLLTKQIGRYPEFAIDEFGYQCLNTVFMVVSNGEWPSQHYLIGILNSTLLRAYWLDKYYDRRRTFPKIKGTYLKLLPIRTVSSSNKRDLVQHGQMVSLVKRMLDLHKKLPKAKGAAKTTIERQIAATDKQIDALVYELYGLTEEEIRIVEGSNL